MKNEPPGLGPLLASPLDNDQPGGLAPHPPPWPIVAGIVAGALAVVAGFWVTHSANPTTTTSSSEAPPTTVAETTVTTPPLGEVAFPPGYEQVTDLIAIKPLSALEAQDTLFITIATAVRRGFEPTESTPFQGGRWTLEASTGETLTSSGTVFDMTVPGSFSIVFALEGRTEIVPTSLRLVERWQREEHFDSVTLQVAALPFDLAEPIETVVGASSLRIGRLYLDDERGELQWTMNDNRLASVQAWITFGDPFAPAAFYRSVDALGLGRFGPSIFVDPQGTTGTLELTHESLGTDAEPNGQATLDLQVTVITTVPGTAELDLIDLRIERSN